MAERVPILRTPVAPGTIIEVYAIGEPLREAGIAILREYLEIMAQEYNLPSEEERAMARQQAWDPRGDLSWRQGAQQTPEDTIRRLREWLRQYHTDAELEVIEAQAYVELTYPEYCQFQEYRAVWLTVGEALDMITIQQDQRPRKHTER